MAIAPKDVGDLSFEPAPSLITGGVVSTGKTRTTRPVDIKLDRQGVIEAIEPAGTIPVTSDVLTLSGELIAPAFLDCHQHLDKSRSLPFTPNPSGTLFGAVTSFGRYARTCGRQDTRRRALATVAQCLRHGTTAIRTHTNVDQDTGMDGLEVLREIRDEIGAGIRIQIVSFLSSGATQDLDWLRTHAAPAARLGDVVGGTPSLAKQPLPYLDCLFETAAETGLPLDLHMDEHLDPDAQLFDHVLDRVEIFGMQGRVTLGHCSVLSAMEPDAFARILDRLADLRVSVVTLPAANLYLQAREAKKLPARGLTRVKEILGSDVTIAAASDNIQDPFVPTGTGDLAEIARWTLLAGQLLADDMAEVFRMVTQHAATVMGLGGYGEIKVGNKANFVISDARDIESLVAGGTTRRRVVSNGFLAKQRSA
ncbi:MAG: amidohydrolase family protein [Rhodobacteraceae bacterium]|nr:amidohydrolase family protein [Paracoccaceae bacterium]